MQFSNKDLIYSTRPLKNGGGNVDLYVVGESSQSAKTIFGAYKWLDIVNMIKMEESLVRV